MPEPMNYVSRMRVLVRREFPRSPDDLVDLFTLLALTRGAATTMKDAHDAWAVACNTTRPDDEDLIPFGQLSPEIQKKDRKYMERVHRVVEEYNAEIVRDRL